MSLRLRYAIYTSLLSCVLFGTFAVAVNRYHARSLRDELFRRTEMHAEHIKASLFAHMLGGQSSNFQSFLEGLARQDLEEVRVFDPENGTILASSIPKEIGKSIYPEDFETYSRDAKPKVFEHIKNDRDFFSKVEPLYNDKPCHTCHDPLKQVIGVLDIELAPDEVLGHSLGDLRNLSLIFLGGTLLLTGGVLFMLTGRLVTTPLHALMNVMQRIRRGEGSVRYHTPRIDEIGHLARGLNTLVEFVESQRKQQEALTEERVQNLERLAAIGSITSSIAHDIKNPLAGISGAVQVISEDLPEGDPRQEIIEEIQQRITALDRAIRDIRNFAKPLAPQFIVVQAAAVLESVVHQVNQDITSASAEVRLQVSSNVPEVEMDPDLMMEALRAMTLFCLRSIRNGGHLTLSCLKKDELTVQLKVEGTDGNVAPKLSDDIFDPLSEKKKSGLGLALAAAKRIISEHHGIITVSPSPEGGIRFVISIPISQKLSHA